MNGREEKPQMTPAEMGRKRWLNVSKARRSELARKASRARWQKRKKK